MGRIDPVCLALLTKAEGSIYRRWYGRLLPLGSLSNVSPKGKRLVKEGWGLAVNGIECQSGVVLSNHLRRRIHQPSLLPHNIHRDGYAVQAAVRQGYLVAAVGNRFALLAAVSALQTDTANRQLGDAALGTFAIEAATPAGPAPAAAASGAELVPPTVEDGYLLLAGEMAKPVMAALT